LQSDEKKEIDQFINIVIDHNLADLDDMNHSSDIVEDSVDALKILDINEQKYLDLAENRRQEQIKAQASQQQTLKTQTAVQRILTRPS